VDSPTFNIHVAGAESNVAAAAAQMGYRVRWLSRLTDNALGQRIVRELTSYGVDCSGVVWTTEDRVGTYFVETGVSPRPTTVVYDRAYSAASKMSPLSFDLAQVASARLLHLTGITPALSDSCYDLIVALLDRAYGQGIHIVFDVNFRARLWTAENCAQKLAPLLGRVHTLIISRQDAETVFGMRGEAGEVLRALQRRFGVEQIALTLAEAGAMGLDKNDLYQAPGYAVQIVDRIGAGDAFAAGVICGLLENDFALGLRYGTAMSALKLTLQGDLFRLTRDDVIRLMSNNVTNRPLR
jgi:2-dehydro-3-deoxygluconokinase